ncbi:hypothetical protein OCU04_011216 [Sclerotinia nivalis]|uniref:Uncharacterized protein n=1 Tax=Sclerotinia nivalis TaxID=352851 RepID=A0A9X0ABU6_9HELO|nr:hypothetical protein OCU04_011216 [Sclerotinia nivalis]
MMAPRINLDRKEVGAGCIVNLHRHGDRNVCVGICSEDPCPMFCKQCLDGCADTAEHCKLNSKSYGHPVLVLGLRDKSDGTYVTFVIISALGSDFPSFKEFLQQRACHMGDPDPLTPCSFGPKHLWKDDEKNYRLNYAVEPSGVNFTKRCYLELPHRYTLKIECFATFRPKKHQDNPITEHAYGLRFTEDSYNKVMEKMGLAKENFVSTDDLKKGKGGATGTTTELFESTSTPGSGSLPLYDFDMRLLTPTQSALARRRRLARQ